MGNSSMSLLGTTVPEVTLSVCTICDSALTVICWLAAPTSSLKSCRSVASTLRRAASTCACLNPVICTVML